MTSVIFFPKSSYSECSSVKFKGYQKYDYNRNERDTIFSRTSSHERGNFSTRTSKHETLRSHQTDTPAVSSSERIRHSELPPASPFSERARTRSSWRGRHCSREITHTKEFEDRATAILAEMRRQRRTMKLESVCKLLGGERLFD